MINRIELNIVVVGEESVGKETFSRMLFLDNGLKIRVDPLSKLSELYLEIDMLNFPNTGKKIMDDCKWQNNLIMQQTEIKSIQNLRDKGINPLFYRHTKRICDLINYNDKGNRINKNIMLTFYFIGNNYLEFTNEINRANILIYITDINKSLDANNKMYKYLVDTIKTSNNNKYLLTLVNKCDALNPTGEYDISTSGSKVLGQIDQIIREFANNADLHQNILPPIPISFKYSCFYRQIVHYGLNDLPLDEKIFISNTFVVKKENLIKDIRRDSTKYLKRSGFISFRDVLADILNTKYGSMIDYNFDAEIQMAEKVFFDKNIESINVATINLLRHKANRLGKIFKKNYQPGISDLVSKILNNIVESTQPNLYLIDNLREIYEDDNEMAWRICQVREKIYDKVIQNTSKKLYDSVLSVETFLPSNVHIMFDELYDAALTQKEQVTKLAMHICELYSSRARTLLDTSLDLLFDTYFLETQSLKISSMLHKIQTMIKFDTYKSNLIQIWLTKLMVAEKYISTKKRDSKNFATVTSYCKILKHYLSNVSCNKYEFLFTDIYDICTNLSFVLDPASQLKYISLNVDNLINLKTTKIIHLDSFIIKRIKKPTYQSLIINDVGSEGESDDDYGDEEYTNFDFNKDDMSSEEQDDDPVSDTAPNKKSKKRQSDKNMIEV